MHQTRRPPRPDWREQDEPECKACRDTRVCRDCKGEGCQICDYLGGCPVCAPEKAKNGRKAED